MASELEKALDRAKYAALPLPRSKSEPTTIYSFTDGHLFIVRNPHTCLPDPPLSVTTDPAVDTMEFTREFNFQLKGILGFLAKQFGIGNAKSELEVKNIKTATVQMGGLAHHTIETGVLIDYLLQQKPSTCLGDVLDKDHFTIVAALQVKTFTYTFKNSKGVAVSLSAPEANGLFKVDASVDVQISSEGKVVVSAPAYVGVVTWDGGQIKKELEKARKQAGMRTLRPRRIPGALENALNPQEIYRRQLASMGVRKQAARR